MRRCSDKLCLVLGLTDDAVLAFRPFEGLRMPSFPGYDDPATGMPHEPTSPRQAAD